jgi:hypothetical protein
LPPPLPAPLQPPLAACAPPPPAMALDASSDPSPRSPGVCACFARFSAMISSKDFTLIWYDASAGGAALLLPLPLLPIPVLGRTAFSFDPTWEGGTELVGVGVDCAEGDGFNDGAELGLLLAGAADAAVTGEFFNVESSACNLSIFARSAALASSGVAVPCANEHWSPLRQLPMAK